MVVELGKTTELFPPGEIANEQPDLSHQIVTVLTGVETSLPPILNRGDHGAPRAGFVDKEHSLVMARR